MVRRCGIRRRLFSTYGGIARDSNQLLQTHAPPTQQPLQSTPHRRLTRAAAQARLYFPSQLHAEPVLPTACARVRSATHAVASSRSLSSALWRAAHWLQPLQPMRPWRRPSRVDGQRVSAAPALTPPLASPPPWGQDQEGTLLAAADVAQHCRWAASEKPWGPVRGQGSIDEPRHH